MIGATASLVLISELDCNNSLTTRLATWPSDFLIMSSRQSRQSRQSRLESLSRVESLTIQNQNTIFLWKFW